MSIIENADAARRALCNGELFQVGGTFIDPRDIVRADLDSNGAPRFHLSDGSTHTHDRFKARDAGDLLFNALEYAQRPATVSENLKPSFNRVLIGGNRTLYDRELNPIVSFPGLKATGLDLKNDRVHTIDSNRNIRSYSLDGSSISTFDPGTGTDEIIAAGSHSARQELVITEETGNEYNLWVTDLDGGNPSLVINSLGPEDTMGIVNSAIAADENSDFVFYTVPAGNTTGFKRPRLFRIDLETGTNIELNDNLFTSVPDVSVLKDDEIGVTGDDNDVKFFDFSGIERSSKTFPKTVDGITSMSKDNLYGILFADGEFRIVERSTHNTVSSKMTGGSGQCFAGLDLSLI